MVTRNKGKEKGDTMIKKIHVYDFDGTIVDSSHRYKSVLCEDGIERIDLQHWIDNEYRALGDSVLPLAEQYREDVADPEIFTIVATARIWCQLTEQFAMVHDLEPNHVIARIDRNDCRGGAELKITGIKKLLRLAGFAAVEQIHVFEDNTAYLKSMCDSLGAIGHYYPSNQGH